MAPGSDRKRRSLCSQGEMIPRFWPLQAAPESQDDDIRKFEAIGTSPMAVREALGEALAYHQAIGGARKAARLRYLTLRWADALKGTTHASMCSPILANPPRLGVVAAVNIEGIDARDLYKFLMNKYRIIVAPLVGGPPPTQVYDFQAILGVSQYLHDTGRTRYLRDGDGGRTEERSLIVV